MAATQLFVKIAPVGIIALDQCPLPRAAPFRDTLFPEYRLGHRKTLTCALRKPEQISRQQLPPEVTRPHRLNFVKFVDRK
jgi:hypothetical protein